MTRPHPAGHELNGYQWIGFIGIHEARHAAQIDEIGRSDRACHRVVDRNGFLSGGWHWGHPDIMAGLLQDEGVPFLDPYRVDLAACLWLPDEESLDEPGRSIGVADGAPTARSSPG